MARSSIQRRQEAERSRVEACEAVLRRVTLQERPAPDFQKAIDEARRGFDAHVVRDPSAWRPQMKTRDESRLRLAAARYLFARYPVGDHLEEIWTDGSVLADDEVRLRKRWYIVAACGGSLYKEGAGAWLTRKEVHAFVNAPPGLGFEAALWQAIAGSYTDDPGAALRIARSRVARTPRAELGFWREAARFFCAHPITIEEMDDLCDFLADCRQRNPGWSLKGRTLASLRRLEHEWRRDLEAIARIEAARRRVEEAQARAHGQTPGEPSDHWPGAAISDWSWSPSAKDRSKREEYMVIQLRTAADLVAETRAMRHCVSTYASKCIAGHASIWSLRRRAAGQTQRLLTIELDRQNRAVQIRGFANRLANAGERNVLERWAKARGIHLP
jgi:hypothetical protein